MVYLRRRTALAFGASFIALPALAQKRYDLGATDTEIKIGQTMPYSGPASAYGTIGRVQGAYFAMLNERGGINGRKINFISLDDGYSPPKTVEMTRRLVEHEGVLFTLGNLGTATNSAIHRYMNEKRVPHLFLASGAAKWNDPKSFPWTMGFNPSYYSEGKLFALDTLRNRPQARIAVLYQNDDFGKDYQRGIMDGLGSRAATMLAAQASYEITDPTVDSQIVSLQASGADTLFNISTAKFAAQAIRKVGEIGWKPVHYLSNASANVGTVLKPAGLDKSIGLVTMQYFKEPTDPRWAKDAAMNEHFAFLKTRLPAADPIDASNVFAMVVAQLAHQVLRQCGDDLTRQSVMRQAASLQRVSLPLLLPGVVADTSPDNFSPFQTMQLVRFDGTTWVAFGQPQVVR